MHAAPDMPFNPYSRRDRGRRNRAADPGTFMGMLNALMGCSVLPCSATSDARLAAASTEARCVSASMRCWPRRCRPVYSAQHAAGAGG